MLKYFGLKEILYGFKKFAILILAGIVLFAALGFAISLTENSNDISSEPEQIYSSSRSYVFAAEKNVNNSVQSVEDKSCATTAVALLKADFTKEYLYNNLLKDYSEDKILEYTFKTASQKELGFNILEEVLFAQVLPDSSVVNFCCETKDKGFSEKIIEHWEKYLNENLTKRIPNLKDCSLVGGTTVQISKNDGVEFFSSVNTTVKTIAVFTIIGAVLTVCVVLVLVLFNPTIATKNDFESYGVPILDSIKEHGCGNLEFATDAIILEAKKQNCNTITIVSSNNTKRIAAANNNLMENLNLTDISSGVVKNVFRDYAALKTIRQSDGVVLVEKKGDTTHKEFSRTLALLKQHNVKVIGIVLV